MRQMHELRGTERKPKCIVLSQYSRINIYILGKFLIHTRHKKMSLIMCKIRHFTEFKATLSSH